MQKEPQQISSALSTAISALTQTGTTPSDQPIKLRTGLRDARPKIDAMFQPFNTFGDPSLKEARHAAVEFCAAMGSRFTPAYWLSLLGPSGTGKTMLAKLCGKFFRTHLDGFLDERHDPEKERVYRKGGFKSWGNVVTDMLEGDYSGLRDLREDWFVCLDDIGAEYSRTRELATTKLLEILNAREGVFTIITANLSLDEINKQMDARIASRLLRHGAVVIDVTATDYNLR